LEDLLRTSTKNVAQEVVSSLIPPQGGFGVLADIDRVLSTINKDDSNRRKPNNNVNGNTNTTANAAVMSKKPTSIRGGVIEDE
jgi:hypothetical protein